MLEKEFKQLNYNVLGRDTVFEGDLKIKGDTLINGQFNGSITVLDQSKVTIEKDCHVEGDLYGHDIEVHGNFSGSLKASGVLTIRSSGNVSGKIQASQLNIYPGAIVNMEGQTT